MTRAEQMEQYSELLTSPKWKEFSDRVKSRDNRKCQCCGTNKGPLHAHHMQYHVDRATGSKKLPWSYPMDVMTTLCKQCHDNGHKVFKVPTLRVLSTKKSTE